MLKTNENIDPQSREILPSDVCMLRGKFLRLLNSEVLRLKNLIRLLILREALSSGVDGFWLTGRQNCRKTVELYLKRGTNSVKKKKNTVYLGGKVIRVGVGEGA